MEHYKNFPRFWGAVVILLILFGLQMIMITVAYTLGYSFEAGDLAVIAVITVLSCGILFSFLMHYKNIGYNDIFNPVSNLNVNTLVTLIIPLLLISGGAVFWLSDITMILLLYIPSANDEYVMLAETMNGGVVTIIFTCIIAPFIEEMLFRGIILRGFLMNYSINHSIILSALLFAVFHLTIIQLPVAFIMGCLFGWLYVRTGSLWSSILAHFLYNTCVMIVGSIYFMPNNLESLESSLTPEFNALGITIIAILSSIIGMRMLVRILEENNKTY